VRTPRISVYSRHGCHLCDELVEALLPLVRNLATVDVCDVDSRSDWREKFGGRVPVVEVDGRFVCQYKLDAALLHQALTTDTDAMTAS
jgi:predicted secreted protein